MRIPVRGLQNRSELNGQFGVISDVNSNRANVTLNRSQQVVSVKFENLRVRSADIIQRLEAIGA